MDRTRITTVRFVRAAGRERLREFIFGGRLGPGRVPRGIDPLHVSEFIVDELRPDASPDAYRKTLDAIDFYECADVLPHLQRALTETENDAADLRRSTSVLRAVGDLGTVVDAAAAAAYLDRVLVPLPAAIPAVSSLLDARIALIPAGSWQRVEARIGAAVDQAALTEEDSEADMMAFDRIAAVQRNELPAAEAIGARKSALLEEPPSQRRPGLVAVYLGVADVVGELIETWAARQLRLEALTDDSTQVLAAFADAIDAIPMDAPDAASSFVVGRAARAILYLGGHLTGRQADRYAGLEARTASFLWDDP